MKQTKTLKAQSLGEYIIFVTFIVLATIVMQAYVRRGLQGRYADVVDVATSAAQADRQFEILSHEEDFNVSQNRDAKETIDSAGAIERVITDDVVTRQGVTKELNYVD
jgi:hypothetical protein